MAGLRKQGFVSCQGESGSCAFAASRTHYFTFDAAPQPSFEDVLRRVVERDAQIGILPLQNTKSGIITEPVLRVANSDLKIIAEHHQPIRHDLLVSRAWVRSVLGEEQAEHFMDGLLSPVTEDQVRRSLLSQLKSIYSDDQGFKQCDRSLKINVSGAERNYTSCTAKAARMLAIETDSAVHKKIEIPAVGAIASEECATMFKNMVLVKGFNDDPKNTTRYFVVSRDEAKPADILRDLGVKTLLQEFPKDKDSGQNPDLELLFTRAPLKTQLEDAYVDLGLGEDAAVKSGQRHNAQARLLHDFLASEPWDKTKQILTSMPPADQHRLNGKLEPLAKDIHEYATKAKDKIGQVALGRLLKKESMSKKLRSVFIIRATRAETNLGELVKPLIDAGHSKKSKPVAFRVLYEMPRPTDGNGKEKGIGLIIEAEGCLIGAEKRLNKKKPEGGVFGGSASSDVSDLERLLQQVAKLGSIRVLGTFAKDPFIPGGEGKLGLSNSLGATSLGGVTGRSSDGHAVSGNFGLGIAAFMLLGLAGALLWYTQSTGFDLDALQRLFQ